MIDLKKLARDCPVLAIFRSRLGYKIETIEVEEKDEKSKGFKVLDASNILQIPEDTYAQRIIKWEK